MAEWNSRANDIFVRAAEIDAPLERRLFLQQQCGDDANLHAQVESLLATGGEVGSFLEKPAAAALAGNAVTAACPTILEGPGTVIGPYRLLQQIGEGGMGVVYMAEQQEPVRRKVALKIIKPGMDSRQVIARFEAERQALAMMDHQNIAKVLDAGTIPGEPGALATGVGRPYFVMELVHGVSFTRYCDDNKLTPRQRLELFVPVCHAVQHAHQKGIIHRDLKPSNILVTMYDDKPVPKVIDFGVAKAVEQRLTEKTLFTQFGMMVGTFEYMSPEQAEMNAFGVDTRSDVYSLGVLLYELLTGTTPLERQRFREAAYGEIVRLIKEEDPPRPSIRLSSSGAALEGISQQRGSGPGQLTALVRGELDWIVMRCLEKDRTRRYETANDLARDVERYLHDEPVEACPPTVGYKLRKFARKHKNLLTTAATFVALLLLGVAASAWQAVRATQAEAKALAELDNVEAAHASEMRQRALAVEAAAAARASEQKAKEAGDEALRLAREEKAARERADVARLKAMDNEAKAESRLYALQIASAQREWDTGNIPLFYHYLDLCRRDFRGWEHDYLYTLANQYRQLLPGAFGAAGMALTADGKRLAVAALGPGPFGVGRDGVHKVQVWDLARGEVVLTLKDTWGCVAFSPDGTRLAAEAADGTVKLWDAASGKELFLLNGHTGTVRSVAFSPDGKRLASSSSDGTVKLWDAESGKGLRTFAGPGGVITSVAFSPDGKQLAGAGFGDRSVRVWDVASGKELMNFKGREAWKVAFSPDGKHLASSSGLGVVKVWELPGGREVITLEGAAHFAFTADGKRLAGGGPSNRSTVVRVWEIPSAREVFTLKGPTGQLAFSLDGTQVASWEPGTGGRVKVWKLAASQDCLTLAGPKKVATGLAFSPDGKQLAGPSSDNTVKLWQVADGREIRTFNGHTDGVYSVAFSPDGKQLASSSADKTVKLWDVASGKEIRSLEGHISRVVGVAFSSDGKYLASAEASGKTKPENRLRVWELANGKEVLTINGTWGALAFSPDSKCVATAFNDVVRVLDVASGKEIMTGKGHASGYYGLRCVVFSPDGQRLASASRDGTVKVWDIASGQDLMTLKGHTSFVESVAFSPDGKRLASGSLDNTVKLWDAASGQEVLTLKGHTAGVACVTFSPNGKRLASASKDSIKIWDASKSMKNPGQK